MIRSTVTERQQPPSPEVHSLSDVIEHIIEAGEGDQVTIAEVLSGFGDRAYGPLILAPAILVASPLSAIPGLPTATAVIIAAVAAQMLVGRRCPWLPGPVVRRRINRQRLVSAAAHMRKVARWVDRVVGPRLQGLATGVFARAIAVVCILIAATMPLLEIVPMANSTSGTALSVFGLALMARDGLLAIIALLLTGGVAYIGASALM